MEGIWEISGDVGVRDQRYNLLLLRSTNVASRYKISHVSWTNWPRRNSSDGTRQRFFPVSSSGTLKPDRPSLLTDLPIECSAPTPTPFTPRRLGGGRIIAKRKTQEVAPDCLSEYAMLRRYSIPTTPKK